MVSGIENAFVERYCQLPFCLVDLGCAHIARNVEQSWPHQIENSFIFRWLEDLQVEKQY